MKRLDFGVIDRLMRGPHREHVERITFRDENVFQKGGGLFHHRRPS